MASHLYKNLPARLLWFGQRFGYREILFKPLRILLAPLVIQLRHRRHFNWRGKSLEYFYHRYNTTWAGERAIEIPIARSLIENVDPKGILEVGNVLGHYQDVQHVVLDKYERARNVINQDILTFTSGQFYELIVSISTFEHIGFDDDTEGGSAVKILRAIQSCRSALAPGGRLVITVPLGYNADLDQLIASGTLECVREDYMVRDAFTNWRECDRATATKHPYGSVFPYANSLLIAEFTR